MSTEAAVAFALPTPDERKLAMLAHVLQLFGGFIAPLIIFLVKRDSRFVKFHALQALIWQCTVFVVGMCLGIAVFILAFTLPAQTQPSNGPPEGFLLLFGSIWFFVAGSWLMNLIFAIYFGIKANEGAWSQYPLIGRLAAAWSGI
jgi:uncharacterized Tic20 family protein